MPVPHQGPPERMRERAGALWPPGRSVEMGCDRMRSAATLPRSLSLSLTSTGLGQHPGTAGSSAPSRGRRHTLSPRLFSHCISAAGHSLQSRKATAVQQSNAALPEAGDIDARHPSHATARSHDKRAGQAALHTRPTGTAVHSPAATTAAWEFDRAAHSGAAIEQVARSSAQQGQAPRGAAAA